MGRRYTLLVLLALAALAPRAGAGDAVNKIRDLIDRGYVSSALKRLERGDAVAELTKPRAVFLLCSKASQRAGWLSYSKGGEAFGDRLIEIAEEVLKAYPESVNALLASGEIWLFKARFTHTEDEPPDAAYATSINHFEKAYSQKKLKGDALARAVCALLEYAHVTPGQRPVLMERMQQHHATLQKEHAGTLAAVYVKASMELEAVRGILAGKPRTPARKAAEARLFAALDLLATRLTHDEEIATLHADIVTFIRSDKKIKAKADYWAGQAKIAGLSFAVPHSRRWMVTSGPGKSKGRLVQFDRMGGIVRSIKFYTYKWNTEYTIGARGIGGDNPKGLCTDDLDQAREIFSKVKRTRRVTKGRINRSIRSGYFFDIGGLDDDGDFLRVRSYYIKSMKNRITLNLYFLEWEDVRKLGPEAQFVIDSLREK